MVYVLSKKGKPLMPTDRHGKVRHLLKDGMARVMSYDPASGKAILGHKDAVIGSIGRNRRAVWAINTVPFLGAHFAAFPEKLVEIMVDAGCPPDGIVLDPFIGSGTVAIVAKRANKHYLGIELNPEFIKIAEERLAQTTCQLDIDTFLRSNEYGTGI